jgi:hypothetical protein
MKKLDAITLEFARQVIEEETGAPLDIPPGPPSPRSGLGEVSLERAPESTRAQADGVKLIARDERKNPLISTFDWTNEAVQRIFRVPAGFMRNKTQERIEELARERAAPSGEGGAAIDLALVEEGIEIGKRMMAEMIATYSDPPSTGQKPAVAETPARAENDGSGHLNEVSTLTARSPNSQLPTPDSRAPTPDSQGRQLGSWKLEVES